MLANYNQRGGSKVEVVEKRIEERNRIIQEATAYSKNLPFKCSVLLIGSYARGDFNLWSDKDLLIIGNFTGNPIERLRNIDFPPGYETIMLTPEEINKMKMKNDRFITDALKDGVILRDDLGIF
jgi:predicted nucleotidyltransferase